MVAYSPGNTQDEPQPGSTPSSTGPEPGGETGPTDAILTEWRRRTGDALLAVALVVNLPPVIAFLLGHGPRVGVPAGVIAVAGYLVIAGAALLRRVAFRKRLWAFFIAAYAMMAVLNLVVPQGPYVQIALFSLPLMILLLLGPQVGRCAFVANAATLVALPILRHQPAVADLFTLGLGPHPSVLTWVQTAIQITILLGMMILLESFRRFLSESLASELRAKAAQENAMRERERLEREIESIGDQERRRVGHDLHDGVCQQLTAAALRCQALERRVARGGTVSSADFQTLSSLLGETMEEVRNVAVGLSPLDHDPAALAPALRALAARIGEIGGVPCEFRTAGSVQVRDEAVAQHLYRIAQEALSNAVRHAAAQRIAVELRAEGEWLILQVEDNGVGMPDGRPQRGMGLRTMARRAEILHAELTVAPVAGSGTRVVCRVPARPGLATARPGFGNELWTAK